MATLRLLSGLLIALLALPLVAAAPAEGRLQVEGPLVLRGPASFEAEGADLAWNATGVPLLQLEAASLHVERYGTGRTIQKTPLGPGVSVSEGKVEERADHASAKARLVAGEDVQVAVVRAPGTVLVNGSDLEVRPVEGVQLFRGTAAGVARCDTGAHCADAFGVYGISAPASLARIQGDLTLYLRGPSLVVTTAQGETTYGSGVTTSQSGTLTLEEETWLVVTAKDAVLLLEATGPAQWFASSPRFDATALALAEGTGSLSVGSRTYRAQGEAVDATGALVVSPEALTVQRKALADETPLVYGNAFTAEVSGDVASINLRSAPIYADKPAQTMGILALAGAVLGGLAYYWPHVSFHATSAALPFYTRLKKPEILDNDVRNAIYAIIRASPGISARAVQRESELSWGTVVYHLRQLERHHLVVSRALGRTRNYYENHGKYKGMEVQLACLQSPRALTLARLILQEPGLTQEALAQASTYPQPTTSYYVRKLKQAGLVEEQREGRYARYLPNADLSRFVALADAPEETAATPSASA